MKYAVYMRVSSRSQEYDMQRTAIMDFLSKKQVHVPKEMWFTDRMSGATMKRPGLAALQKAIDSGEAEYVVMYSMDRFARTMIDGLIELDRWKSSKTKVMFLTENMEVDFGSWYGDIFIKMLVAIRLALAEGERAQFHARQLAGIKASKEKWAKVHAMQKEGMEVSLIAKMIGLKLRIVNKMLRAKTDGWWGGQFPAGGTSFDREKLDFLVERGTKAKVIAKKLGCSLKQAYRLIKLSNSDREKSNPVFSPRSFVA